MDKKTEEILEGLKTAMEAEVIGHGFYKHAAATTTDPQGKETFERMAEEEMGHFNYLKHQYKSVLENGDYDLSDDFFENFHKNEENPVFSDAIKSRVKDAHFEVSALSIGMKLELDAMNYYRSCAKASDNKDVKKFFNELAEWEGSHFNAFKKQLDLLKDDYFQANNFVPT